MPHRDRGRLRAAETRRRSARRPRRPRARRARSGGGRRPAASQSGSPPAEASWKVVMSSDANSTAAAASRRTGAGARARQAARRGSRRALTSPALLHARAAGATGASASPRRRATLPRARRASRSPRSCTASSGPTTIRVTPDEELGPEAPEEDRLGALVGDRPRSPRRSPCGASTARLIATTAAPRKSSSRARRQFLATAKAVTEQRRRPRSRAPPAPWAERGDSAVDLGGRRDVLDPGVLRARRPRPRGSRRTARRRGSPRRPARPRTRAGGRHLALGEPKRPGGDPQDQPERGRTAARHTASTPVPMISAAASHGARARPASRGRSRRRRRARTPRSAPRGRAAAGPRARRRSPGGSGAGSLFLLLRWGLSLIQGP